MIPELELRDFNVDGAPVSIFESGAILLHLAEHHAVEFGGEPFGLVDGAPVMDRDSRAGGVQCAGDFRAYPFRAPGNQGNLVGEGVGHRTGSLSVLCRAHVSRASLRVINSILVMTGTPCKPTER